MTVLEGRRKRLAEIVADALRAEILSLKRAPGEPIAEHEIATAHGVSRTPVREALLRLADEGLVDIFPQSGTFVSRVPVETLPEALEIRRALEQANLRMAARRAGPAEGERLRAALAEQTALALAGDQAGFHAADEAFHAQIAAIAGQAGFWALVLRVKAQVDRFRLTTLPVPGRMGIVVAEHRAMAEAVAQGDEAGAVRALDAHLDRLLASIREALEASGERRAGAR